MLVFFLFTFTHLILLSVISIIRISTRIEINFFMKHTTNKNMSLKNDDKCLSSKKFLVRVQSLKKIQQSFFQRFIKVIDLLF
jgi:hypothetical protein